MTDTKFSALSTSALTPATDTLIGLRGGTAYQFTPGTLAGLSSVTEALLSLSDVTTGNATTSAHGFLPKLNGNAATFLDGTGAFSTPAGGGGGSGTVNSGTAGQLAYYAATGTAVSGDSAISVASAAAASTPLMYLTGGPYAAGTATTNFPMMFLQPTGATAVTTWSTAGTFLGINAASGYTGKLVDLRLNGASSSGAAFSVQYNGDTLVGGAFTGNSSGTFAGSLTCNGTSLTHSGTGGIRVTTATATLSGTTAGTIKHVQPFQGASYKKWIGNVSGYENNSAVNQTITFPVAFANAPSVVFNDTGLTLTVSTSTLTIVAPNNTTLYNGNIIVEGI